MRRSGLLIAATSLALAAALEGRRQAAGGESAAGVRQRMVEQYDRLAPTLLRGQRTKPDPVKDPHGILVGQFRGTFNCRKQEGVYILAYLHQEKRSKYYRDREVLDRVVLSLDYLCRAQGNNGGLNEYRGQGGWCGVQIPKGGNATRGPGKSSVVGFTFYCLGRSIVLLKDEPAFRAKLQERIDNDGNGTKDVRRRDAYRYLIDDKGSDGPTPGAMAFLHGHGRGHGPNQDAGALAAVQALNEAYAFLSGGVRLRTRKQIAALRDDVLFKRRWFSAKGMLLERGHGGRGYDANYGVVTLHMLGAYARYAGDAAAAKFIAKFMEGYQHFYVLDDRWPKGAYHEFRTARRSGGSGGLPVFAAGLCQDFHDSLKVLYAAGLRKLARDPSAFFRWGGNVFQIDAVRGVDLLLNWQDPKPTAYVLPCNAEGTFVYRDYNGPGDPQANVEVVKTGRRPETVTWKAYHWDGGVKSYTYLPPGKHR